MKEIKYFTAAWCSPCKALKPIMEELQNEGFNVVKIDVDENQEVTTSHNVRSVPTLMFFENGTKYHTNAGVMNKEDIIKTYNQ